MAITADVLLRMSSQKKIFLTLVIVVVIWGLYTWGYYLPKNEQLDKLAEQVNKVTTELNQVKKIAAEIPVLEKEIEALDLKFKEALVVLPEKREVPTLLSSIAGLVKDSNLNMLVFKPLPESFEDFFARVPMEISVAGGYHDVARFFEKVSKLPRIVNISNISMREPKEEDGNYVVVTSGMATTFRFLSEEEVKRVADEKKKKAEEEKRRREGAPKG